MRRTAALLTLMLSACEPKDPAGGVDDTGDTDEPVVYDEGCITVAGGGGYAHINDAIAVASEGDEIVLCAGTYEEAVLLDKAVSIIGGADVILSGPSNEVALTITATGASVTSVAIASTRNAVSLEGATGTTLTDIAFGGAGGWQLSAVNATDTVVADCMFGESDGGGAEFDGGSATISGSTFERPTSFALYVSGGAVVTAASNTINGTAALGDDDGVAMMVDDATLITDSNVINAPDFVAVYGNEATLDLSGDTIAGDVIIGPALGVYHVGGNSGGRALDIDGLTITNCTNEGIFGVTSTDAMSVRNTTVTTESSCDIPYELWGTKYFVCGAILLAGEDQTFENVQTSGYENHGIVAWSNSASGGTLAMSGVTVSDAGRTGINVNGMEGTITDTTVTGLREPEYETPCSGPYIQQSASLILDASTVVMSGVSMLDNDGWGIVNVANSLDLTGGTFDGNYCAGIINFQGALVLGASTFSNSSGYGGLYDYEGVTIATGNTWTNNHHTYSYEYTDDVSVYRTEYDLASVDIQLDGSNGARISGNTFVEGDFSIYISAGEAEITGNTWTTYGGHILNIDNAGETTPVVFTDNTIGEIGGSAVTAAQAAVEFERVTIGATHSLDRTYTYYTDGVVTSEDTYNYAYAVFDISGYSSSTGTVAEASLSLTDVEVESAYYQAIGAYEATVDLSGVTVGSVGEGYGYGYGLYATWATFPAQIEVEGFTAGDVAGYGIYLSSSSADVGYAAFSDVHLGATVYGAFSQTGLPMLSIADSSFGDADSVGLRSESVSYDYDEYPYVATDHATEILLSNVSFGSSGSYVMDLQGGALVADGLTLGTGASGGVYARGMSLFDLSGSVVAGGTGDGIGISDERSYYSYVVGATVYVDADTVATLTDLTVTGATDDGVSVSGGSVTLAGVTATGNDAGLYLDSVAADVQGNTFTTNTTYGMECSNATLDACAGNDLSGNGAGEHIGCDDACGLAN